MATNKSGQKGISKGSNQQESARRGTPEPVTAVQLPSKKSLAVVEPSSDLDVVKIFKDLKSIPNMEKFLNENPQLKKDFLKHLSLAKIISKDKNIANGIMADLEVWKNMVRSTEKQVKISSADTRVSQIKKQPIETNSAASPASRRKEQLHPISTTKSVSKSKTSVLADTKRRPLSSSKDKSYPFDGDILPPNAQVGLQEMSQATYFLLRRHIQDNDKFIVCGQVLNYFDIVSAKGKAVYRAYEGSETICNSIFPAFSITIKEIDVDGKVRSEELTKVVKKHCHFFTKRFIKVFSPCDFYIGAVKQKWTSSRKGTFVLVDYSGTKMIEILVNPYSFSRYKPTTFEIRNIAANQAIGTIEGHYIAPFSQSGLGEYKYEIKFPKKLNCNIKLLVITAWLMIYKLYFDKEMRKELKTYTNFKKREKQATSVKKKEDHSKKVKSASKSKPVANNNPKPKPKKKA